MENEKNVYEMLKEKYEERGWNIEDKNKEEPKSIPYITPLPLSEEEYKNFSILLGKLALQDENRELCSLYFNLQRRADYGNNYPRIEVMKEIEPLIWEMGTTPINNNSKANRK